MPFISRDDSQHAYQIYEKTFAVDYIGNEFKKSYGIPNASPDIADPMLEMTEVPAHVMTIAQTSGGRDGFYFLCDTERWTVTICDFQFGPKDTTNLTQVCCSTVLRGLSVEITSYARVDREAGWTILSMRRKVGEITLLTPRKTFSRC